MSARVAFVAPLPPPVHGFSNICAAMLELLRANASVAVFDRAPRIGRRFSSGLRQLANPVRYAFWCLKNRNAQLYLGLSGGRGQLVDWAYVLIARVFRHRIVIHHHSFAYLNAPSLLARCVFSALGEATHVVLSRRMGVELARVYRLNPSNVRTVSNAAFAPRIDTPARPTTDRAAPMRIGYLSAVSVEKGMVEFFQSLSGLTRCGIAYRASIAGAVDPAAQSAFDELLASASHVQYTGPLYGEAKDEFYRQLDVFLFPTGYANEAEPLVVLEAMRSGALVIACGRGAIPEMLSNGGGVVLDRETFAGRAVECLRGLDADREALRQAQERSWRQARRMHDAATVDLAGLLSEMSQRGEKGASIASFDEICGHNRK